MRQGRSTHSTSVSHNTLPSGPRCSKGAKQPCGCSFCKVCLHPSKPMERGSRQEKDGLLAEKCKLRCPKDIIFVTRCVLNCLQITHHSFGSLFRGAEIQLVRERTPPLRHRGKCPNSLPTQVGIVASCTEKGAANDTSKEKLVFPQCRSFWEGKAG